MMKFIRSFVFQLSREKIMRIVPVSLRIALGTLIFTLAISFTAVAAGVIMRASTSDSGSQGTSVSSAQEISAEGR